MLRLRVPGCKLNFTSGQRVPVTLTAKLAMHPVSVVEVVLSVDSARSLWPLGGVQ